MVIEDRQSEIAALMLRIHIFQGLTTEQLVEAAGLFQPVTLERNTVIFSEGAPPDCFYIVFEGKVRAVQMVGAVERELGILTRGDFFGEEGLLYNQLRSTTMITMERTTLLRLDGERFYQLIQAYPDIEAYLATTAESRRLARHARFDWLREGEVVYLVNRKHDFFLLRSLVLPIVLGILALPVLVYGFSGLLTPFFETVALLLGSMMLLAAFAWGVWNWLDWGNDYYIVTNLRVIWLEKVIGLYDSRREAPLETVQTTDVITSQLGRILNYGDVTVRTFTGSIVMRRMSSPYVFSNYVDQFKVRAIAISKEREREELARELDKAMQRHINPSPFESPLFGARAPLPTPQRPYPATFRELLATFLKVRYERGGVITYRKHWLVLMGKAWKPLLGFVLWIVGLFALAWFEWLRPSTLLLMALVFFFLILWLVYYVWDWSNDIYRLTPEQIFDIERRPLGREEKKTAKLENILSIEHERENLIGILFNFGNVVVNVGQTQFTFDGVYNPDQVHQDVADYREALTRRRKAAGEARERERMLNWLLAYYDRTEDQDDNENTSEWGDFSG